MPMKAGFGARSRSLEIFTLVYAVFIAGLCSIIYELLIATTAAYFEGDTVKYFSLTIGLYMAAMGLGAYASKFIVGNLLKYFVAVEIVLGLLGGLSIPVLYLAFSATDYFLHLYAVFTLAIGFLIGLEIPFLTRLLEGYDSLRINIAHVLTLDYFGAVIATVAFPLILLPFLGNFRTGLGFGLINMTIGLLVLWCFSARIGRRAASAFTALTVLIGLAMGGGLVFSDTLLGAWDKSVYDGRIVFAEQTRYQRIVLTKYRDDIRLYLDGNLQFSSIDEHRYHEALVHVPMALRPETRTVLLLGAGDGLAARELLKYPGVESVTVVELDPVMVRLASTNPYVSALNEGSLTRDSKVRVVTADAFVYLRKRGALYDLILADLPDPNNTALARLYTKQFYRLIHNNLAPGGLFVTQATSPVYATKAFWSIRQTVAAVFAHTYPYHLLVPSFGDWGFVLASDRPLDVAVKPADIRVETRFLDARIFRKLFVFEKDLIENGVEVSTLDRPVVLSYYLEGWRHWGR